MMDMRYRGPEEFPNFGNEPDWYKPMPDIEMPSPPGYQQPPGGGGQQPQQGPGQYYQQMRESMSGMDKALKELEGMQMPGGQYQARGRGDDPTGGYTPGGGKGKGISY